MRAASMACSWLHCGHCRAAGAAVALAKTREVRAEVQGQPLTARLLIPPGHRVGVAHGTVLRCLSQSPRKRKGAAQGSRTPVAGPQHSRRDQKGASRRTEIASLATSK